MGYGILQIVACSVTEEKLNSTSAVLWVILRREMLCDVLRAVIFFNGKL